jgi:hypothetical protein
MSNTTDRLALYEAVLSLIDRKRAERGDPTLGESLEQFVVETQFREVEREILDNPGAIEPWLIRRRREGFGG